MDRQDDARTLAPAAGRQSRARRSQADLRRPRPTGWATCIVYSSVSSPMSHPQDSTVNIVSSIIWEKVKNGENVLAVHDYRSSNWWLITGARFTTNCNYLASIGKRNVPVIFDEPNRHRFTYASSESEFTAAATGRESCRRGHMGFPQQGQFRYVGVLVVRATQRDRNRDHPLFGVSTLEPDRHRPYMMSPR